MTVFLVVGAVGASLLILSIIGDGLSELLGPLDVADGLFSLITVGSALTLFGAAGFIAGGLGLRSVVVWPLAVGFAAATWIATWRVLAGMRRSARHGVVVADLVGMTGRTTLATNGVYGEVRLREGSLDIKRLARNLGPERLETDTPVRVCQMDGSRVVVTPITEAELASGGAVPDELR